MMGGIAPKEATEKEPAPKKATVKEPAPKKATAKEPAPKKAAPKKPTPKKATKEPAPKKATATASKASIPQPKTPPSPSPFVALPNPNDENIPADQLWRKAMTEKLPKMAQPPENFNFARKSYTITDPNEKSASNIQVLLSGRGSFYITNVKEIPVDKDCVPIVDSAINGQGGVQFACGDNACLAWVKAVWIAGWECQDEVIGMVGMSQ